MSHFVPVIPVAPDTTLKERYLGKKTFQFLYLDIVFKMIYATICFFTHFLLAFLMSKFDVRRYNGSYLSCFYASRPMKFTTFIDESVEKKKISNTRGGFKVLP